MSAKKKIAKFPWKSYATYKLCQEAHVIISSRHITASDYTRLIMIWTVLFNVDDDRAKEIISTSDESSLLRLLTDKSKRCVAYMEICEGIGES